MNLHGDRHNFGQQVKPCERASGTCFRKPRSVFWEHLFFGQKSPLKQIFSSPGENGTRPLSDYFFNLEVEIENTWSGYSKAIVPMPGVPTSETFYSFGALLAYCYFFGIQDLHRFNLVDQGDHLQVIDAEVVLSNLTLPHETLLLPFKSVDFNSSGIGLLAKSFEDIDSINVQSLLTGYFDMSGVFLKNYEVIKHCIGSAITTEIPVRVILRSTGEYIKMLESKQYADTLLPEERTQLDRDDVPYFFKYYDSDRLYFMADSNLRPKEVELSDTFLKDFRRVGANIEVIFSDEKVLTEKAMRGVLYLLKKVILKNAFEIRFLGDLAQVSPGGIELKERGVQFKSTGLTKT